MKKSLLFVFLLFFSIVNTHAKASNQQGTSGTWLDSTNTKLGIRIIDGVSFFGEYKLSEQLSIQSGLGLKTKTYSPTGFR